MDIRDVREALWRAYRVALDNGLDCWKASEAHCEVKYPDYFTSEDEADFFKPYELEVYSYALGPSRSHYFRRADTESQPQLLHMVWPRYLCACCACDRGMGTKVRQRAGGQVMDEQIKPVVRFVSDLSCGGGGWCVGVMREANSTDEDPDEWYVKYADHQQAIDTLRAEADGWKFQLDGLEHLRLRDNAYLLDRAERAEAEAEALRTLLSPGLRVYKGAHVVQIDAGKLGLFTERYEGDSDLGRALRVVQDAAIDAARKVAE